MSITLLNIAALLDDFQRTFYTEPLMIVLNVVFLVLSLRYKSEEKMFRILRVYAVAALVQDMVAIIGSLVDEISQEVFNNTERLNDTTIIFFIQIEFYAFYRVFYFQFANKPMRRRFNTITCTLLSISAIFTIYAIFQSHLIMQTFIGYLSVISSILILTPSLYYFYTLFTEPPIKNLLKESSFWITTGIAFLYGLNIPLFLISNYLQTRHLAIWFDVYTINFVAYCFLFILFIIGILCNENWRQGFSHRRAVAT